MRINLSHVRKGLGVLLSALLAWLAFAGPAAAAPCASNCLTPGDYTIAMVHQGLPRLYLVHVPASYTGQSDVPLLLDFHGGSKDAWNERQYSGQLAESDRRGFIAVWPNGIGLVWNAYGCCLYANTLALDDVGFTRAIVTALKARAAIDPERVYATGISNGGGMAHRLACEAADIVRGAVSVSYPLNTDQCQPSRPVSVTSIAGTADANIPYDGAGPTLPLPPTVTNLLGAGGAVQGARQSLAAWKVISQCSDALTRVQLSEGSRWEEYRDCAGGVRTGLVTIANGKHVLYNGYVDRLRGYDGNNAPIDVADFIWTNLFNQ